MMTWAKTFEAAIAENPYLTQFVQCLFPKRMFWASSMAVWEEVCCVLCSFHPA